MKGAIFDLDGVLVDTAKYHFQAWQRLAHSLGIEFTEDDNEALKGVSRLESLERILDKGNIEKSVEEKEELMQLKNQWYLDLVVEMTAGEALPGAIAFLEDCKLNIGHLFDAVVDGNVVNLSKPNPTVFLTAAQNIGLRPEDCIVFEDAIAGVQAAKTGGFYCVGIGTKENLPLADEVAHSLGEYSIR